MSKPKRPPIVLLAVAAALVAVIGWGLWRWSRFNDVWVVNGLPVAVEVSIDGKAGTPLAATVGRAMLEGLSTGTHVVEVKHDGTVLETTLVFVKGGSHELVYNIGGAAPVVWEKIAYSTRGGGQEPAWTMYCGQRFIELDSVDYVFTTPPKSISVKGGGTVYKTHVTVDEGGIGVCHSWALDRGTLEMWVGLQRLEAKLDPTKSISIINELARQGDLREAQLLTEQAMEKDRSFELRQVHELVLLASNQTAKVQALYAREVADEAATDVDLYFSAVLKARAERLAYLDEALQRFPQSPHLHLLRGQTLDRAGQSEAAVAAFEAAESSAGPDIQWGLYGNHARALVHLARKAEAWSLAGSVYKDSPSLEGAVAYANLARATGHSDDGWDSKLKPQAVRWGEVLLDMNTVSVPKPGAKDKDWDPATFKKGRELIQLTVRQTTVAKKTLLPPYGALAQAAKASDSELRLLPEEVVWLLLTEAWRVGDTAAAAKLSRQANGYNVPRLDDALELIATGRVPPRLDTVGDPLLAVLWLARGRRLATLGEDPKDAYAQARRLDAFGSIVTRALDRWPPATPGNRLAWLPVSAP